MRFKFPTSEYAMPIRSIAGIVLVAASFLMLNCERKNKPLADHQLMDSLAREYVKLGLKIGQFDADFVDAYYGPDSLKPALDKQTVFPKDSLLEEVQTLKTTLLTLSEQTVNDTLRSRATWIGKQLTGFERRIQIFTGNHGSFDDESRDLFDAVAPEYPEEHFKSLISELDQLIPGKKSLQERYENLAKKFLIPENKIDTVFRAAIAEARKLTLQHYKLPENESFTLEYVRDKPWSGYNWYQGDYKSIIQINVSQPIFIERAIDLACHEGYPGHHVFNVLLEKNLYRDKAWPEVSLYPLFSPQSLIAEGSANYGISVAFPDQQQEQFCKTVLLPLAGLDTTHIHAYFKAMAVRSKLSYTRNEVARGILSGNMSDQEGLRWLSQYCLLTPKGASDYLRFIKKYRSYVINYNYGQDLVRKYIESDPTGTTTAEDRWKLFETLLRNQFTASDLTR
jgi:hypothetical protein